MASVSWLDPGMRSSQVLWHEGDEHSIFLFQLDSKLLLVQRGRTGLS